MGYSYENDEESEEKVVDGYVFRNVKPSEYRPQYDAKIHRKMYDDPSKRVNYKNEQFGNKNTVEDVYTQSLLHKNANAADRKYGTDMSNRHKTQVDHTTPIAVVYDKMRANPFVDNESIKKVANDETNYQLTSGNFNQSKGSKTNSQYVKGNNISGEERKNLLSEQRKSENAIYKGICQETIKGMNQTGMTSAKYGGAAGAVASGIYNIEAIANGNKDILEAVVDVGLDIIKSASNAYVNSIMVKNCEWGMTYVADTIEKKTTKTALGKMGSKVSSKILNFAKWDSFGMVVSIAMDTGKLMKLYLQGKMSADELLESLSQQAVSMSVSICMGSMGGIIGGALAGLPGVFVGDVIGSVVGGILGSQIYKEITFAFKADEYIGMYKGIADKLEEYNKTIDRIYNYMDLYKADVIRNSFWGMRDAILNNNVNKFSDSLDNLCRLYGTRISYSNNDDFDAFWNDTSVKKEWRISF